jgi:predicted GNAT family acetyltransferase
MEYYVPVRAELSRWILHKKDPYLSRKAESLFRKLAARFEASMEEQAVMHDLPVWQKKLVFETGIPLTEQERILSIFRKTTFLEESILLTFKEQAFSLTDVPDRGIWILRLLAFKEFKHYRLSVNTLTGKHFDLHLVMSENPRFRPRPETFYWMASLAGFPFGPAVAPMLGSSRPALGILTSQYIGGLTAWDKIRELSEIHRASGIVRGNAWKKIFIKAFCVIFKAWHHSGKQIVPGAISPANVSIPEMDFRESAVMLSIAGWTAYHNTLSLVEPMLQDFYCRTSSLYPWCREHLSISWIFDACIEALGREEAMAFLTTLQEDAGTTELKCFDSADLKVHLAAYLSAMTGKHYLPLALFSAIDQYQEWYRMNPLTTTEAKEQTIHELLELYKLRADVELVRYFFFRHTYFSDVSEDIRDAFDHLLQRLEQENAGLAIQLTELSDLQSVLTSPDDRTVFSRMVFPRLRGEMGIDFLRVGENLQEHVVVRFTFTDRSGKRYTLREPVEARETGQLYQLFFREKYPKEITGHDHQYILTDENDRIVGGLTYRFIEERNILLDGIVVTSALQGKGIATAMLDKFFASMAARGVEVIKAHFLFGNYYLKHLFDVDKKWGALVKRLN